LRRLKFMSRQVFMSIWFSGNRLVSRMVRRANGHVQTVPVTTPPGKERKAGKSIAST
jgi:hypothetical protein